MRRLKDKVSRRATIKIDALVEQRVDGPVTENKTIAFLVEINMGNSRKCMFRANSNEELWYMIEQESWIEPIDQK